MCQEKPRQCCARADSRRVGLPRALSTLAGVLAFGIIVYLGGLDALKKVVRADPLHLLGILTTTSLMTFAVSLRWGALVDSIEGKRTCSHLRFYYYHILSKVAGLLASPSVGDLAARPLSMKASQTQSLGKAVFCSVLDKMFDVWLLVLFSVPSLLFLLDLASIPVYSVLLVACVGIGSIVIWRRFPLLMRLFLSILERLTSIALRMPLLKRLVSEDMMSAMARLHGTLAIERSVAMKAQAITVFKYVTMVVRAYFVSEALSLHIPLWVMFFAMPIVQASVVVSITPAGLGIQELGWYGAFALVGIDRSRATVFLIGQRAYVFLSVLLLAAITHVIFSFFRQRNTGSTSED